MAEVALAAGFNSIRRFNATFQALYQRPPRELRRSRLADAEQPGAEGITLKLPYAPPYDWDAMIDFLGARAIRGIEAVDGRRCYRRSIGLDGAQGVIRVEPDDREPALLVSIRFPHVNALAGIVRRVRRVFDLSADPLAIGNIWAETRCSYPSSRNVPVYASQAPGTALKSPSGQFSASRSLLSPR
jgi:AraC family transcriptional regulator of adaptative response / DNA-3-methyladenine glycosylase II